MPLNRSSRDSSITWFTKWPLFVLFIFTIVAAVGYGTFGRHPEWLSFVPNLASFFAISFTFFAQGHIALTGIVLAVYLTHRTGKAWLGAFGLIYVLSLMSELAGTTFGLPFGEYAYSSLLGAKWFDRVPLLIPLSWFTMAVPAFALSYFTFRHPTQGFVRIAFGALLLTVWDLSLDPAMSYLTTYWNWGEAGPFYGMPWINLFGWYVTGIVLMGTMHLLKAERWIAAVSFKWMMAYYGLVFLMPLLMVVIGGLWWAMGATLLALGICALIIKRNDVGIDGDELFPSNKPVLFDNPEALKTETLNDFFSSHSRSFSFAARFFSTEQRRLVTRLYAFCRTTDDIADSYAARYGKEKAEEVLDAWEQRVMLAYQGIPSEIQWLDELMARSVQSGVPYKLIQDLIYGVRSDLGKVEIKTMEDLERYTYCVASVVGIWLCYLFGVRKQEVLDRASALGRAMQITNILRDVGEDLRMHRLYLPADLLAQHKVTKDELLAMEAGTLAPTQAYKAVIEDLMERAEADYLYAFRGLTVIPPSFARASAVASQIYRGIHRAIRRNRYNNFKYRAYTHWYEKTFLTIRALRRLKKIQKRPFIPTEKPVIFNQSLSPGQRKRQVPLNAYVILFFTLALGGMASSQMASAATRSDQQQHVFNEVNRIPMDTSEILHEQLRAYYLAGVEDEMALARGLLLAETALNPSETVKAYHAALTILHAKHAFWPPRKMRYLNAGLPVLDALVKNHANHVEIRYLRLLSCYYLPRFLGRTDTVTEDAGVLARLLPEAGGDFPRPLFTDMVRFVSSIEMLSDVERRPLENLLTKMDAENATAAKQISQRP